MLIDSFYALVLIAALDANSFRVRESAEDALFRMGYLAVPYLHLTVPHSPEQRMRSERVLSRIRNRDLLWLLGRHPVPAWIDLLPDAWPDRTAVITRHMNLAPWNQMPWNANGYPHYRSATWHLAMELLAGGKSVVGIDRLLFRMERRGAGWNGHSPIPADKP